MADDDSDDDASLALVVDRSEADAALLLPLPTELMPSTLRLRFRVIQPPSSAIVYLVPCVC